MRKLVKNNSPRIKKN
uniref:Uncharacterized protein n=1 Tax=Rhizophora mucronata TaxID=61149 RepID=A0A2P2P7K7_RHIMU